MKDLLKKSTLLERLVPLRIYKQAGIQLWGKGAYARESVDGGETAYTQFNRIVAGDVVLNKIWARNGAVAVIPEALSDYYVSTEFPVFSIDTEKLEPMWMRYVTQQKWFWDSCNEQSFGTSGKNRIKPEKFLEITIPLPPKKEQQRIILKIEAVRQRLAQISELRSTQEREIGNLLFSKYTEIIEGADWAPMGEVAPIHRRPVDVEADQSYQELGIRSFGRGVFEKPAFKGSELTWQKPYWLKAGDFLLSNIKAWEGAVAVVPAIYDDWVGSHRYITCLPKQGVIESEFLFYFFTTRSGLDGLGSASPGTADRNRTLNTRKLANLLVPVPDIELQREFLQLRAKLLSLRAHHTTTAQQLESLLPSLLDKAFKGML